MIWIVLSIMIIVGLSIKGDLKRKSSLSQIIFNTVCTFCIGFLAGVLIYIVVGSFIGTHFEKTSYVSESNNIYSLEDKFSYEGTFILGFGGFSEDIKYYYLKEVDDKGLILDSMEVDNCYVKIIEDNSTPRIECISSKFINDKVNLIAIDSTFPYYILYVPKDTIKINYNIDLE